jgi:hypothetical protein
MQDYSVLEFVPNFIVSALLFTRKRPEQRVRWYEMVLILKGAVATARENRRLSLVH